MNVKDAIAELKRMRNQNAEIAFNVWTTEDVTVRCKERKIKLTPQQKKQVLVSMRHGFDAAQGMNWDTMDAAIDEVIESTKF